MAELIYWKLELTMQVACEISTSGNHEREAQFMKWAKGSSNQLQ
jgi:hypothetical protein